MRLDPGTTSVSLTVQITDDNGLPVTGLVASTLGGHFHILRAGEAAVNVVLTDLAAEDSAWFAGGVKESSTGGGYYRFDPPDFMSATATKQALITLEATGIHLFCEPIQVEPLPPIPDNWLTALGIADGALNGKGDWAKAGDEMALTSAERTAIASAYLSLADGIETGITPLQAQRAILAAACGVITTSGSNPEVFKNPAGSANRLSVANDTSGNRTAVTITA
jgi:hypothetical protein